VSQSTKLSRPCPACGSAEQLGSGEKLRELRQEAGKSLREVAARAGLSMQYLCELELGRKPLREKMFERVARVLLSGRR